MIARTRQHHTSGQAHRQRSGQAMLFLIMVLLIGTLVVLWNFDMHRAVILKMKVRDAGDAAAMASARWQGIALNTIGELNLINAAMITEMANGDINPFEAYATWRSIVDLQSKMIRGGPIVAFAAAQQAAYNNGIHAYAGYHFWVDGNDEFADFLDAIVQNGIAAQLVNSRSSDHPLMDPYFYEAIDMAREGDWCLFNRYPNLKTYLEGYTTAEDYWPDKTEDFADLPNLGVYYVPPGETNNYSGSINELFDLDTVEGDQGELQGVMDKQVENTDLEIDIGLIQDFGWFPVMYNQAKWTPSWQEYIDDHDLPFNGDINRDRYDYMWGQNIYQLHITYPLLSPRHGGDSTDWVSAAKVFGHLEGAGGEEYTPNHFGMVLPAFRDVRLIAVPPNVRDPDLEEHYNEHIDDYLDNGISALDENDDGIADNGCPFCQALIYFDNDDFREAGLDWLSTHQDQCDSEGFASGDSSEDEKGAPYGH